MKTHLFILAVAFILLGGCGKFPVKLYRYSIDNRSNESIIFYLAWGGTDGIAYPDTCLNMDETLLVRNIPSGSKLNDYKSAPWEEVFSFFLPKDTLSVYFFSVDTLAKYNWEEIKKNYKVLARYDLSLQNLEGLDYTITYPPTEAMKNIKMFPPYKKE